MKNIKWIKTNIVKRAKKLKLWNMKISDRIYFDVISHKRTIVKSVSTSEIRGEPSCLDEEKIPAHLLPNSIQYVGMRNRLNWITSLFEAPTRQWKESALIVGWKNGYNNKFILYWLKAQGHLRDEGKNKEYWRWGVNLLKCEAFQVMALNKVVSGWELKLSTKKVRKIIKEVKKLVAEKPTKIDYKRVYIPKSNGKVRALGVPTLAWRIYLHMWNVQVVWYRTGKEGNQHGYFPKKGCWTAWRTLFPLLEKFKNIYEYDFKNFFPEVDLEYNKWKLVEMGVPMEIASYLKEINQSIVKLNHPESEDLVDESADRKVILNTDDSINENLTTEIKEKIRKIPEKDRKEEETYIKSLIDSGYTLKKKKGVPQGASTSCGLATVNIEKLFNEDENLIGYSDDGIVATNNEVAPNLDIPEAGVMVNHEKSNFAKWKNKWVKAIKFLGLEYIPENIPGSGDSSTSNLPRLRGATRNGSKLEFDTEKQFMCYISKTYNSHLNRAKDKYESMLELSKEVTEDVLSELKTEIDIILKDEKDWTIKSWLQSKSEGYQNIKNNKKLNLLFDSPLGPNMLAKIYNNSNILNEPANNKLIAVKGSWATSRYGGYLYEQGIKGLMNILETKVQILSSWEYGIIDPEVDSEPQMKAEKLISDLKNSVAEIGNERVSNIFDKLFKWKRKEKDLKENICKESEETEKVVRILLKEMMKEARLTLYNSSSLACHDLLELLKDERSLKVWDSERAILHCRSLYQTSYNLETEKKLFEESKQAKRIKLIKKINREVMSSFRVKS